MTEFELHAAAATLSQLIDRAAAGEDVIIARDGRPVARLVPIGAEAALARVHGALRGRIALGDDVDELPDDVADAFGA